jgi:hypothetical protein
MDSAIEVVARATGGQVRKRRRLPQGLRVVFVAVLLSGVCVLSRVPVEKVAVSREARQHLRMVHDIRIEEAIRILDEYQSVSDFERMIC